MSDYSVINKRSPRLDAPDKARGKARYIDDLSMPEMLYGALLQSPVAHARILNIDTSRAQSLPGVKGLARNNLDNSKGWRNRIIPLGIDFVKANVQRSFLFRGGFESLFVLLFD